MTTETMMAPSVTALQTGDVYERSNLTRMQMLYWTGQQLRPQTPLFTAALAFHINTPLDLHCFRQALQTVIDHSDAMRTVIQLEQGVPQRCVQPEMTAPLVIQDFSAEPDPVAAARTWFKQRSQMPFDMTARLFDVALAQINAKQSIWYINQHHILSDAAASFLIFGAVKQVYEALMADKTPNLSLTPFQMYVDYEREYRHSAQYQRARKFWSERLVKSVAPLPFFGRPSTKKQTHSQRRDYDLGPERTQKLKEIARQKEIFALTEEMTLFNVLAALYFAHLYQLTGAERLSFLAPMHNRPTSSFRQTIGLLMEICPFFVEIGEDETILSLIQQMQKQSRSIMRYYQYGSSISLQNKVHDVMFNFHRRPSLTFAEAPVQQELVHPGHSNESYALHVHEFEESGSFVLKFDFHEEVFTAVQKQQAIDTFVQLVDAFIANVEQPVDDLPQFWQAPEETDTLAQVPARQYVAPRDMLELRLKHIWEEVLGVEQVGIHENFFDLGGSSWQAMTLFAEIEKISGQYLPLATLLQTGTIAGLAELLRAQAGTETWPLLVTVQEGDAERRPFFCVHGGGGHVIIFNRLARNMGEDQPFYAFQAQGLDGKQSSLATVEAMADRYVQVLRQFKPEGPYCLGGYSMGGAVAFEMAQQLQAQGETVELLAIIDTPAQHPKLQYVRRAVHQLASVMHWDQRKEDQLFLKIRNRLWLGLRHNFSALLNKIAPQKATQTGFVAGGVDGAEAGAEANTLQDERVRKITALNNRAFYFYIPKPYDGRITLFKSTKGYLDKYRDTKDPFMGWRQIAAGGVDVMEVPGNHNDIMLDPDVKILAQKLRSCLNQL